MIKKGYLKRIVVKQPDLNQSDQSDDEFVYNHDFLVLDKEKVFLGRNSKDCDLIVKGKIISRKHVVFSCINGEWYIECLNEKNGVFVNGNLLEKNQVTKLDDNYIISFGPTTFNTDFLYQFTTQEIKSKNLFGSFGVSYLENTTKTANLIDSPKAIKMNESTRKVSKDALRSKKSKKMRILETQVNYLEEKLDRFKEQRKESRLTFKKINKKLKLVQSNNHKLRVRLKNLRSNLNKERSKKKELLRKLADQLKNEQQHSLVKKIKEEPILVKKEDEVLQSKKDENLKLVQKYKEIFSEDFTCGICLELFIDPVSSTCGHSFCKFCLNEWLKRNPNKRGECPMCRASCRGYFKNVVIENIIQKYLITADEEILGTRSRLIDEREKVIEASKNDPNNEINIRRVRGFDLNNHDNHSLIEVFNRNSNFRFLDFHQDDISSNDEIDEDEFYEEEFDNEEDYSEDEETGGYNQFNIVLE